MGFTKESSMSYTEVDWNKYRRDDQSLDLLQLWLGTTNVPAPLRREIEIVELYIKDVERIQRINSRQAAAIVLAQATYLVCKTWDEVIT